MCWNLDCASKQIFNKNIFFFISPKKSKSSIVVILAHVATFSIELCDIELGGGDQEFFTQFLSIDILWAHRLRTDPHSPQLPPATSPPPFADREKESNQCISAFLCGPALLCSTGSVFTAHVIVPPPPLHPPRPPPPLTCPRDR